MYVNETEILNLSGLSALIAGVFREAFGTKRFWVKADIIGLKMSRGHCYLQLAEKDEITTTPKAEFRAIIWANSFSRISQRFQHDTGSALKENMQILCLVEVQYHERYSLSLLIHDIDSSFSLGLLEAKRRQTLDRLKKEGYYTLNKQLIIPSVIQRIAVISAEDSKGYEDFYTRLTGNQYGLAFHVALYPSLLQGDLAAQDIISRFEQIMIDHRKQHYDAVVIVRGGGGSSSLECFNDYALAKTIALCPLPVITGIGHTSNRSIVDEIANNDRITPTEAAVFIVEHTLAYAEEIERLIASISELAGLWIEEEKNNIHALAQQLMRFTTGYLLIEKQRMQSLAFRMHRASDVHLRNEGYLLQRAKEKISHTVSTALKEELRNFDVSEIELVRSTSRYLLRCNDYFNQAETRIRILDPAEVLKRGYNYSLQHNKLIRSVHDIQPDTEMITILSDGTIKSKITTIENG